jgi:hypothetical protein
VNSLGGHGRRRAADPPRRLHALLVVARAIEVVDLDPRRQLVLLAAGLGEAGEPVRPQRCIAGPEVISCDGGDGRPAPAHEAQPVVALDAVEQVRARQQIERVADAHRPADEVAAHALAGEPAHLQIGRAEAGGARRPGRASGRGGSQGRG